MGQKLNYKQSRDYVEIARYNATGVGATAQSFSVPTGYKYVKFDIKTVRTNTVASRAATRITFNNITTSVYPRRYQRWTTAGAGVAVSDHASSIIAGITDAQWNQCVVQLDGTVAGFGWPKFGWRMYSDAADWSYGYGHVGLDSGAEITSFQIHTDNGGVVSAEIIIYGHN